MSLVVKEMQDMLRCDGCLLFDEENGLCHWNPTAVPTHKENFCSHCALVVAKDSDIGDLEKLRRVLAPEVFDGGDDTVQ